MSETLYPYQENDARFMARRPANLLAYEAGLGKTATAIRTAELTNPRAPWFVCTVRNAKPQWKAELKRWAPWKREDQVVLTHYEEASRFSWQGINSGVVILDEGDEACNVDTQTFRTLLPICRQRPSNSYGQVKRILYVTATPVHNGPKDLLSPLILCGIYNLEQYTQALLYYCDPIYDGFGGGLDGRGVSNLQQLREVLKLILVRRTYPEAGRTMPPLSFENIRCDATLSPRAGEYAAALADFRAWYRQTRGQQVPPLAKYSVQRRLLALSKVATVERELRAELAAGTDHNFLVFSEFREPVEELHGKFKGSGLVLGGDSVAGRERTIEAMKAAEGGRLTFATTGALSSAINAQSVDRVYYVDLGWTPKGFDQTSKRAWRLGQGREVRIRRFYFPEDPLEKFITDTLKAKLEILKLLGLEATGGLGHFSLD